MRNHVGFGQPKPKRIRRYPVIEYDAHGERLRPHRFVPLPTWEEERRAGKVLRLQLLPACVVALCGLGLLARLLPLLPLILRGGH